MGKERAEDVSTVPPWRSAVMADENKLETAKCT